MGNPKKSNFLASEKLLDRWRLRNEEHNLSIINRISELGFLTDKEKSHKVVDWAYAQAAENHYIMWGG